jgi:aldehyde dehydrogenase (NAD+)
MHLGKAAEEAARILGGLGLPREAFESGDQQVRTPITGEVIGRIEWRGEREVAAATEQAQQAFVEWRRVPAPRRGELVRLFGEELRAAKTELGTLVTIEAGKIVSEGAGEVQEMIDICTFAAGLSRQLYGLTMATERANHRMMETWHPLGVTGILSAFNFPVAVWAWNAALALVCGNPVIWKPSEKTPLCALATQALFERAVSKFGDAPAGLSTVLNGGRETGAALVANRLVPLVSATGSTAMGRAVGPQLAARFARAILELGGNNAAIVCRSADLELALRGIAFAAMGTAGQRCTTLRRLLVEAPLYEELLGRLRQIYCSAKVGDPREAGTLVGPLIDQRAFEAMQHSLIEARDSGARVEGGGRVEIAGCEGGYYVRPALVEIAEQTDTVKRETFAPILYVMKYRVFEEALRMHNDVPQGLASAIFTTDMREAERFLSAEGSDCGIANVNIGPSGAEIGGAFGGEKETGGGREAGSDVWKLYMRRATNTLNYGRELPLAQGVKFEI